MMKHIRTFILLMTSMAMSHSTMARHQSHAGGSVPGCNSHGNANIHNPHCRGQVQPIVPVTDHTTGSVSTSQQTVDQLKPPQPANITVSPMPSGQPLIGYGTLDIKPLPPQVITGYGPVGSKTGNKAVGQQKYVTPPNPQPVIAPPKPVVVVAGTYGPHFSGTSPVTIPDVTTTKLNKPAGNKQHQTPLPIYVNSKAGKVLVGYGTSQNSASHKVVVHHQTLQGGDKHKDHVSPKAANNLVVGFRSTHQDAEGTVWTCALSGLQRRLVFNDEGQVALSGDPETFHFRDPHTAHLPSNHRFESDCAVVINKQL